MILAHSSHELERMVRCIYQNLLANPSSGTSNKIPEVREATFRQQVWGPSSLGVFFRNQVSLLADDGLDVTAWPNRCGLHTLKKSETSMKLSGIEPCRFETRNFKLAMQLFSRGSLMRACLKTSKAPRTSRDSRCVPTWQTMQAISIARVVFRFIDQS